MKEVLTQLAYKVNPGDKGIPTANADQVLSGVLEIVYYVAGIACIIVIVVAGILYAVSDGDAAKIKTAKNAILYAVVGLLLIIMAFTITGFVLGRFT